MCNVLLEKTLKVVLLLLAVLFVIVVTNGSNYYGSIISIIALPLLIYLHLKCTLNSNGLFVAFLVFYFFGRLFGLIDWFRFYSDNKAFADAFYYLGNIFFVAGYVVLSLRIIVSINLIKLIKQKYLSFLFLIVVSVCVSAFLSEMLSNIILKNNEISLQYIYNFITLLTLSVVVINNYYRPDRKSIQFTIATVCMVFSEYFQLFYFYVANYSWVAFIYSVLIVLSFIMFYIQTENKFEFFKNDNLF